MAQMGMMKSAWAQTSIVMAQTHLPLHHVVSHLHTFTLIPHQMHLKFQFISISASPKTLLTSAPNVIPPYGSQSFATPTMMPTNTLNNPTNLNSANGTCLHCNTMRRTTGVHQTTQTGPVSPIPQNINNNKTVFLGFSESNEYDKMTNSSASGLRAPQQQIQPQPQQQNVQPQTFNRDGKCIQIANIFIE